MANGETLNLQGKNMDAKGNADSKMSSNHIIDVGDGASYILKNLNHYVKENLYRRPNIFFKLKKMFDITTPLVEQAVKDLNETGITILPNYIDRDVLESMQENYQKMIKLIESTNSNQEFMLPTPWNHMSYKEQYVAIAEKEVVTNDPFKHDINFLHIALDLKLLDIIERYLGGDSIISQALAPRYYPMPAKDFGSWQWHHDGWGKRINMLLFLTDVNEDGQYTTYLKGSHKLIHSFAKTVNSRFDKLEMEKYKNYEKINCICKAGTIVLIDSNGIHRGNRSLAMHRDALIVSYGRGRYIWKFDIPASYFNELSSVQRKVLLRNPRINLI